MNPSTPPPTPVAVEGSVCDSNPQAAAAIPKSTLVSSAPHQPQLAKAHSTKFEKLIGENHFRIGVLIARNSHKRKYRHVYAMNMPASSCDLAAMVFLGESPEICPPLDEFLKINLYVDTVTDPDLLYGEEGYEALLKRPDIDAVYVVVPPGSEQKYVLAALKAGKHVLVKDPVSTFLEEFQVQLEFARRYGKFIQFQTMFVHQYRVRRFMDRVLTVQQFGRIHTIDAMLRLGYDDVGAVGVRLPLTPKTGCIRALGRFCVLVSTLMFNTLGYKALSAQVHEFEKGETGALESAKCTVHFTEGRKLRFNVGYFGGRTRQQITARTDSSEATMDNFVLEHPDGLATYRVYQKKQLPNGKWEVVTGEAIDVTGGPKQETMMWRTFVDLAAKMDQAHGWEGTDAGVASCTDLASVALQTKRILLALLKSVDSEKREIQLTDF